MEIIGKVILTGLLLAIVGTILRLLSFIYKMLNPKFRNEYFKYLNLCKKIKETGDESLLKKFIVENSKTANKYNFYYDNNIRIDTDELYNSKYEKQREVYIKILETINKYSLSYFFKTSLKNIPNIHLTKYLKKELKGLELKEDDERYHVTEQKILKSKKRFLTYLIKSNNEDKHNLKIVLENIKLKIK